MKAVILAAGIGKRLQPITHEYPKAMVTVKGKPILQKIIEDLKDCGITDIIVVVGYLKERIEQHFGDGGRFGVHLSYSVQHEQLGTGHAVLQAEHFFSIKDKDFILMFGDCWVGKDAIKKIIHSRPGIGVLGAARVDHPERFGVIESDGQRIKSVIEKPKYPPSDLAVSGVFRLPTSIFNALHTIPKSIRGEYELPHAYMLLIKEGTPFEWVDVGDWTDVGTIADLEKVNC
ncbi:MAG: nucleotidyltransferase family protein [Nanoarchaeota archaeon]